MEDNLILSWSQGVTCEKTVLTPAQLAQLESVLNQAIELQFSEVTIVIERGALKRIKGPTPSQLFVHN